MLSPIELRALVGARIDERAGLRSISSGRPVTRRSESPRVGWRRQPRRPPRERPPVAQRARRSGGLPRRSCGEAWRGGGAGAPPATPPGLALLLGGQAV